MSDKKTVFAIMRELGVDYETIVQIAKSAKINVIKSPNTEVSPRHLKKIIKEAEAYQTEKANAGAGAQSEHAVEVTSAEAISRVDPPTTSATVVSSETTAINISEANESDAGVTSGEKSARASDSTSVAIEDKPSSAEPSSAGLSNAESSSASAENKGTSDSHIEATLPSEEIQAPSTLAEDVAAKKGAPRPQKR